MTKQYIFVDGGLLSFKVLENHHAAMTFRILRKIEFNILYNFKQNDFVKIRK